MWAIVLPVASVPLIGTMLFYQRRIPKTKSQTSSSLDLDPGQPLWEKVFQLFWFQLDLPGAIFLLAGLSLLLVPLSFTGTTNSDSWTRGSFIAMLALGVVFLIVFFYLGRMVCPTTFRTIPHDQQPHRCSCLSSRGT